MIKNDRFQKFLYLTLLAFSLYFSLRNLAESLLVALPALLRGHGLAALLLLTLVVGGALAVAWILWRKRRRLRSVASPPPNANHPPSPTPYSLLATSSSPTPYPPSARRRRTTLLCAAAVFLFSFLVRLVFIHRMQTPQFSDFELFYWVTNQMAAGDPKYLGESYFRVWAYQAGFPAMMAPVARVFPANVHALLVANCVFMAGIQLFVFLISRTWAGNSAALGVSLFGALLPLPNTLACVYTNQHLSALFFIAGFCCLLKACSHASSEKPIARRIASAALSAVLFALGNLARPEGVLMAASVVVFAFVALVSWLRRARARDAAPRETFVTKHLPILLIVPLYLITNALGSRIFVWTGLNPHGLGNDFPLYKIAVGLNPDTRGAYSTDDAQELFQNPAYVANPQARDARARALIRQRLKKGPLALMKLVFDKETALWAHTRRDDRYMALAPFAPERVFSWGPLAFRAETASFLFLFFDGLGFFFLWLCCAFVCFRAFQSKENPEAALLLTLLCLMAIGAFALVEVQHRYAYFLSPFLILFWPLARRYRQRGLPLPNSH